ncbi:WbqC family protein [Moorena producens]|uniref:WbqC family protein n=1 Tax=Moorena producens TaxID=1155739 RepID=UPI003C7330E0
MIVSINQPAYIPWLGYFHRIAVSDVHIVLDHVQFEKNSFTNRNKVRTSNGWSWLTVPVKTKNRFGNLSIKSLEIENQPNWKQKHWKTLLNNYRKAPYFEMYSSFFLSVYQKEWQTLNDLCQIVTSYLLDTLGIKTRILFSSQMNPQGLKDSLVLDLCQKVNAQTYLSGALGKNYLREEIFEEAGIQVTYQDYHHPQYEQCQSGDFEPFLSAIDLIFNHGPDSLKILTEGQDFLLPGNEK